MTLSGGGTEQHVNSCRFSAASLALQVIFSGGTTKQHIIIAGFGELAAVN